MKRGTPRHPKVEELAIKLGKPKYAAVGLLEMLWHFTAEFAQAGDVGRFSDDAIAKALCWDDASSILVSCLIETGWLDRCECHRLRVHDWPDHADQTVQRVLDKRNQGFIKCYDDPSICLAKTSQPSPSPSPSPIPIPTPSPSNGVCSIDWLKEALGKLYKRPKTVVGSGYEEGLMVEICRRPDAKTEFHEILEYHRRLPEKKWFPNSGTSLLNGWQATLDKARTYEDPDARRNHI